LTPKTSVGYSVSRAVAWPSRVGAADQARSTTLTPAFDQRDAVALQPALGGCAAQHFDGPLVAVIGIALLIFGLIEAELRAALGPGVPLPGILPEGRAAIPTARAARAAFDGLHLTYTPAGPVLDRLSRVQRTILALLNIRLPWPEKPA